MPPSGSHDQGESPVPSAPAASQRARKFEGWSRWILPLLFLSAPLIFLVVYDAAEIYEWFRYRLGLVESSNSRNSPD